MQYGTTAGIVIVKKLYPIVHAMGQVMFGNSFVYANIGISPESILKNEIGFFSVNFFGDANGGQNANTLIATMRNIVSQVYVTVRDICLVAMLIVMIYVAIRGLIALSPKEKY